MTLAMGLLALLISIWEFLRSTQKLIKIGWMGWVNILLSLGAKYRKPIDVSHLLIPPESVSPKNIEALKAMNFRRLGEAQIKSPFNAPATVWVFTNLETGIQAEAGGKRVSFSTYFQEKVLVVTDFPNGEHIETPNYQSHTIATSVGDAYNYHLQQVAKFCQKHGQPHSIKNMNDYLRWEIVGRKNYAMRKLWRWIRSDVIRLIAFTYGCLVLILTPLLFYLQKPLPIGKVGMFSSLETAIYLMVFLLLPAILVPRYFNHWNVQQTHKDSRMQRSSK